MIKPARNTTFPNILNIWLTTIFVYRFVAFALYIYILAFILLVYSQIFSYNPVQIHWYISSPSCIVAFRWMVHPILQPFFLYCNLVALWEVEMWDYTLLSAEGPLVKAKADIQIKYL